MHSKVSTRTAALLAVVTATILLIAAPAQASHSWGSWHWHRTANPFTLTVRNSLTDARTPIGGQNWPALLGPVASDWSGSTVLDLAVQPQSAADLAARPLCAPELGAVRVCNAPNPDVTWLGLATVYPNPTRGISHVIAATAQLNDTWFGTSLYNATNARHVLCQEVGHTFGLDHQSESGADLNTCMDYAEALDNPSPNSHDFQQIQTIYSHLDSAGGIGSPTSTSSVKKAAAGPTGLPEFPTGYHGTGEHSPGHSDVFVTKHDGMTLVHYVTWAY